MPNIAQSPFRHYATQLLKASKEGNWHEIQHLDLELRSFLKRYQRVALSQEEKKEMAYLKSCHQQTYQTLSKTKDKVNTALQNHTQNKERNLAYQITMDLE